MHAVPLLHKVAIVNERGEVKGYLKVSLLIIVNLEYLQKQVCLRCTLKRANPETYHLAKCGKRRNSFCVQRNFLERTRMLRVRNFYDKCRQNSIVFISYLHGRKS